jgi:preprotein translocase subunit SecE
VARNRKRAKERRDRRGAAAPRPRPSASNAEAAPSPLEHAAPDVELADAQIALGQRDVLGQPAPALEYEPELEDENGELEPDDYGAGPPSRRGRGPGGPGDGEPEPGRGGGAVAQPGAGILARLMGFLQGSWRELQRVQWPDRRQVAQATGVVIGFVIIAGIFLGVADLLAGHLMTFILTGHW